MDPQNILPIRFHFGGTFDYDGYALNYVGGSVEMSHVVRDKLSLPELRGYLCDHIAVSEEDIVDFYWLFPGAELSNGLRSLSDDQTCMYMSQCITEGVAEVYAVIDKATGQVESPVKNAQQQGNSWDDHQDTEEEEEIEEEEIEEEEEEDSEYEHLNLGDEDTSEDDEEANKFKSVASNQRKNPAAIVKWNVKEAIPIVQLQHDEEDSLKDDVDPLMIDSSEEASYDSECADEGIRRRSRFARYDSEQDIPTLSVGMTFTGRKEFKAALIKYGLQTRRHLMFPKDEKGRIRAKCSWKGCPWVIFASNKTNSDRFQIKTYHDVHICPKRKDNRLVTGPRIADKYEHIIKANPSWKLQNIKETVLLEMGVDVSLSKIKRAKAMVMRRIYESCRGEYAKIFEYQAEILRSNPGSTVAICLDPEYTEPVFQRIYICFDACKKGFEAGCRKVIGIDGCFFKGACNGELICALARDANNQIYPVAGEARKATKLTKVGCNVTCSNCHKIGHNTRTCGGKKAKSKKRNDMEKGKEILEGSGPKKQRRLGGAPSQSNTKEKKVPAAKQRQLPRLQVAAKKKKASTAP